MLILEGPDCIGKTRAAKRICQMVDEATDETLPPERQFPVRYDHMGRPSKAFDFFRDYQDLISQYAVMDRFHLGALVWHEGVMNLQRLRIIEGWLYSQASVIVVMCAAGSVHYETLLDKDHKDQMFDKETLIDANRTYTKMVDDEHPLHPQFDFAFVSTKTHPYPDDNDLLTWWNEWCNRLKEIGR